MTSSQDAGYKALFGHPDLIRDLIMGFVPDEWLHSLDYSTLEKVPGSYVSEDFREREDDVVWRGKAADKWAYLYLVIEFQSTIDRKSTLGQSRYWTPTPWMSCLARMA